MTLEEWKDSQAFTGKPKLSGLTAAELAQIFGVTKPASPPMPPPPDPFVFASRVAAEQPIDPAWRYFQGVLFRAADVLGVYQEPDSRTIVLRLAGNNIHKFQIPIEGICPTRWFSEHVLRTEFQRPAQ